MSRITRNHKKYLNMFENDLLMIHRGDADLLADIYERDIMNDEARLGMDTLLAMVAPIRATPADIFRVWRELWGDRTPEQVSGYSDLTDGEQYDQTQLTNAEIAEMENRT